MGDGGDFAGALISGGLGYYQGLRQEQLQRDTNAQNIALWEKQVNYNTPANQVARLKEAGLNPALMYGTGSGANMASSPPLVDSPKARGFNADPAFAVAIQQARLLGQQRELVKAQTEKQNMDNAVQSAIPGSKSSDNAITRTLQSGVNAAKDALPKINRIAESIKEQKDPWASLKESITPAWMQKGNFGLDPKSWKKTNWFFGSPNGGESK